jgi:hypothetical protein
MTTGPFGVEVVSKSVKSQLKLVGEAKAPLSLRMGGKLPSGSGRGGPKKISLKQTQLNMAGTQARKKFGNG